MLTEILFASSILILGILLTLEDLRFGIFLFLLFLPLVNKALFSLIIWDLLPIRIITVSLGIVAALRLYQWWRDPDYKLKIKKSKIKRFFNDKFLLLLLSLWVVRLISFVRSENLKQSILLLGFYSSMIFLYGYLKYVYSAYRRVVFFRHLGFYKVIGVTSSLYALVQFYLVEKSIILPGVWAVSGHLPRVGSTFWDVNHFAAFILTLLPLSYASLVLVKQKDRKVLNTFVFALLLLVFMLTGSRSAWLGFGTALVILFVFLLKKNYRILSYYIISISAVILITIPAYTYLQGKSPLESIRHYIHYRSESYGAHMWLLQGAWEIFLRNPIIGGGYGNFDENFRKTDIAKHFFVRDALPQDVRIPSHSIWGEVVAETGILGFVLYISLMVYILCLIMSSIKKAANRRDQYYSLAFLSAIAGLLTAGIFYTYNLEFFWLIIFWGVLHARRILA